MKVDTSLKEQVQETFHCCGFNHTINGMDHLMSTLPTTANPNDPKCDEVNVSIQETDSFHYRVDI